MSNLPSTTGRPVTLGSALSAVTQMMEFVDFLADAEKEGEVSAQEVDDMLDKLVPKFTEEMDNFKERIDARISFLEYCDLVTKKLKNDVDYLNRKAKTIENIQKRLKDRTKEYMLMNPGIEFKGNYKGFKIQANGGKTPIEYYANLQTWSCIVDPTDLGKFPPEFLHECKGFVLDKEALDSWLNKGNTCEGATLLQRGNHLRIR